MISKEINHYIMQYVGPRSISFTQAVGIQKMCGNNFHYANHLKLYWVNHIARSAFSALEERSISCACIYVCVYEVLGK